jgi:heme-degrading monooxygenase HmoA
MFARMTLLPFKPENVDEAIRLFRTSVIPEAKKQKGFRGSCFLINRAAGQARAVTFWRSEKDALANEESLFYQEQLVKFLSYFSGDPIRDGYEVVVHNFGEPAPKKPPKPKTGGGKSRK